jgi:hypothetical protein
MRGIEPADPIMLTGMTDCLAIAVENAVLEWGETVGSFLEKFMATGLADLFSSQVPFVTTGCTGEELVAKVNERYTGTAQEVKLGDITLDYTEYYWVGYALALFVAERGLAVSDVLEAIPADEWLRIYPLCHEYGDELLLDKLDELYRARALRK